VVARRAVYYCAACKRSLAPADVALGLDSGSSTAQARAKAAYLGALLSFAQAADALERLANVTVSPDTVERMALAVGFALGEQQQKDAQSPCLPDRTGGKSAAAPVYRQGQRVCSAARGL